MSLSNTPLAAALVSAAALAAALALPSVAYAGDAPGNNGTLKVHGPNTPFERMANEPRVVCRFYLAGFQFDSNQVVNYRFNVQGGPDNGDPAGTPGSFTVGPANGDPQGAGRTPVLGPDDHDLENGRYKVTGTTNDGSKTKVFNLSCDDDGTVLPTPTPTPTPGGGGGGGGDDGDDGGVGGVGTPQDDGEPGVGGVATGGGGLAGVTSMDVALPLAMTAAAGIALAIAPLRRRRSE